MFNDQESKSFKTICIIIVALMIVALGICIFQGLYDRKENLMMYNLASEYMQKGKYEYAIECFEKVENFKDSKNKITECYVLQGYDVCPNCGCRLELRGE